MTEWICATCAVEYPDTDQPPPGCPICSDERQYVRPSGQRWTTLAELQGYDAGVSFRTVHDPDSDTTHTVIANWSNGAWPVTRALDKVLLGW